MNILKRTISFLLNPRARLEGIGPSQGVNLDADDSAPRTRPGTRLRLHHIVGNLPLMVGLVIVAVLFLAMLFGPLWTPHDPNVTTLSTLPHFDTELNKLIQPPFAPSAEYPLGTDRWGNDILSLLIHGARVTLLAGVYITLVRVVIGTLLGSLAGWNEGKFVDRLVMGIIAAVASIPALLSGLILILALGIDRGLPVFIVALSLIGWTEVAEYVRSELFVIRKQPYIEGAEAIGLSQLQTVVRHAFPNLLPSLLVISFLEMGTVLILLAELGFLGVFIGGGSTFTLDPVYSDGAPLNEVAEWGVLIAQGAPAVRSYPHLIIGPAIAFFVAVIGFNALGEGLRRLLKHTAFGTGFLLQRRALILVAGFVGATMLILKVTGPDLSYARVAQAYDGQRAEAVAERLAALSWSPAGDEDVKSPATEYISTQLREYDVQRGAKAVLNQSYLHPVSTPAGTVPGIVGFIPGYDGNLADELVVLLTTYEATGTGAEEVSGLATMLEMVRLWQEEKVDPRRSLLLLAWPDDDPAGAQAYIENAENFSHLPIPANVPVRPAMVFQLGDVGSGGDTLQLDAGADEKLASMLADAAGDSGVDVERTAQPDAPDAIRLEQIPCAYLRWSQADSGDTTAPANPERLRAAGETLTRTLLQIVRQKVY